MTRHRAIVAVAVLVVLAGCHAGARGPAVPRRVWRWTAPPGASVGMPAADDDAVAFTYGRQRLVLLDGRGHVRWQAARLGVRDVAPRLAGPLVLAATDDGVAAFARDDGRAVWATSLGDRASTPVPAGGLGVVTLWNGGLAGLDLDDGHVVWRAPLPGRSLGPPAGAGSLLVATWEAEGGDGGGIVAVDADGRPRWSTSLPGEGIGGPAVVAGGDGEAPIVVVVAGDGRARGLDGTTGAERWRTAVDAAGSPEVPPLPVGRDVLVADRLGGLTLVDARSGAVRWHVFSDGAAVRGGPAGPGPSGAFALPLDDGRLWLARRTHARAVGQAARLAGIARGPASLLLLAGRDGAVNTLDALTGW